MRPSLTTLHLIGCALCLTGCASTVAPLAIPAALTEAEPRPDCRIETVKDAAAVSLITTAPGAGPMAGWRRSGRRLAGDQRSCAAHFAARHIAKWLKYLAALR